MKKLLSLLTAFIILSQTVSAMDLSSSYAIVTDYATGYVIYERNADVPCYPASMTKVMALYVFFSEMESHGIDLDTPVTISRNVARLSTAAGLSNVNLRAGQTYTVDQLLSAICTASACAAVVALAEEISGSEAAFVELMNSYAAEMGLAAHYTDCYGASGYNRITPRSMAALAKKMIEDFPVFLSYSSATQINWEGRVITSTNLLLPGLGYAYEGADGLKTGSSAKSGCSITATAVRDGRRIISVEFGAPNQSGRFNDSRKLLDYGFEHYRERIAEFYNISCEFDCPEQVCAGEALTVCATLGNITVPMSQKGEWLVNDVPVAEYRYDSVWIDNGSKIYFTCNTDGYDTDSLKLTLRLYTESDSITFDKVVNIKEPVSI